MPDLASHWLALCFTPQLSSVLTVLCLIRFGEISETVNLCIYVCMYVTLISTLRLQWLHFSFHRIFLEDGATVH
jgi:hypothetical protein